MEKRAGTRVKAIKQGNPLDKTTMIGAQASNGSRWRRSFRNFDIGKQEGAQVLAGGKRLSMQPGELSDGYYIEPTVFKGNNKMRIFQEEILGRWFRRRRSMMKMRRWHWRTTHCMGWALACGRGI